MYIRRERCSLSNNKLSKQTLCFHDLITSCFTLFIYGGPCHLSSFNVLGTIFFSVNSLFNHLWKNYICLTLYYHLINIVNINILSLDFLLQNYTEPL